MLNDYKSDFIHKHITHMVNEKSESQLNMFLKIGYISTFFLTWAKDHHKNVLLMRDLLNTRLAHLT